MLKGINLSTADWIVRCRKSKPFTSYEEFVQRTQFTPAVLALLSDADAFRSLHESRRTAYWKSLPAQQTAELFDDHNNPEPVAPLPVMSSFQQVNADYRTMSLTLRQHPLSFLRGELTRRRVMRSDELRTVEHNRRSQVAGLVTHRQRPGTAKGITFMTLEDEAGTINLIIHLNVWERFHQIARQATALIARGTLQRQEGIIHILVDQLEDLSPQLSELGNKSRDFR